MRRDSVFGSKDQRSTPFLVVSQLPPPHHGSTIMTQVLLETFEALGVSTHLVERRFSKTVGDVGKFTSLKVLKSVGLMARIVLAVMRRKPSACVLFITNRPASFLVDWLITETLRFFKCPIINYVHTSGYTALSKKNRLFYVLVRRALGAAQTTVCLGPALTADVSWAINGNPVTIPNTPYRVPPATASRKTDPTFLFLSNLLPEKGADEFIKAAVELCELHPTSSFVVAGAPQDPDLHNHLTELVAFSPYANRITMLGKADEDTKWQLLQTSHALVFPSTYAFEAQPLTIVEAMAMGLPVIAYDVGGVRDLVKTDRTGRLVKEKDYMALRDAMSALLYDPGAVSTLGANAREYFDSEFSREAYTSRWHQVVSSISSI
ncbi:glycosyltransferase family 4 protein [Pseudarthrobacter oxydans]|uniref:glycosyltransferase family 4 protein n=1 Tax=Pseudarthrobacter oxydans TaxID=1671 RepID=UPI0038085C13